MKQLTIGVAGTGHLGKIHLKCLGKLPDEYRIAGFYDPDPATAREVQQTFGLKAFNSYLELVDSCEIVDIVSPTKTHFDLIQRALERGKHVFAEKPVTESLDQAKRAKELMDRNGLKLQVGHVERYNPAFIAACAMEPNPMFIEGHRLAVFNPRGTDVSVVHDLMIHDLDILVALLDQPVSDVRASGVSVVSDQLDICNARIEFVNGAVANLTASRVSLKNMRKLRLFQPDSYISVDFLEKQTEIVRLTDDEPDGQKGAMPLDLAGGRKWIELVQPQIEPNNAIMEELRSFHGAVALDRQPEVTLDDAIAAMELMEKILEAIDASTQKALA